MDEVAILLGQLKRLSNLMNVLDISWGYNPNDIIGLFQSFLLSLLVNHDFIGGQMELKFK